LKICRVKYGICTGLLQNSRCLCNCNAGLGNGFDASKKTIFKGL